jgi:hypothetical protein
MRVKAQPSPGRGISAPLIATAVMVRTGHACPVEFWLVDRKHKCGNVLRAGDDPPGDPGGNQGQLSLVFAK